MFGFLNRSIPFPKRTGYIETKGTRFIKIDTPLIDDITALVIVEMLAESTKYINA